jgi:hypothetical protein
MIIYYLLCSFLDQILYYQSVSRNMDYVKREVYVYQVAFRLEQGTEFRL